MTRPFAVPVGPVPVTTPPPPRAHRFNRLRPLWTGTFLAVVALSVANPAAAQRTDPEMVFRWNVDWSQVPGGHGSMDITESEYLVLNRDGQAGYQRDQLHPPRHDHYAMRPTPGSLGAGLDATLNELRPVCAMQSNGDWHDLGVGSLEVQFPDRHVCSLSLPEPAWHSGAAARILAVVDRVRAAVLARPLH